MGVTDCADAGVGSHEPPAAMRYPLPGSPRRTGGSAILSTTTADPPRDGEHRGDSDLGPLASDRTSRVRAER